MSTPSNPHLDPKQQYALDRIGSGHNVFLSGYAGTGESTVLKAFQDKYSGDVAFLAPTGIAALSIGGTTFHRFLGLPPMDYFPASYLPEIAAPVIEAMVLIETFVIDEISMVRTDLFSLFERILREYPVPGGWGKPFGGRQIILSGDFCQLPPVVKIGDQRELNHFLENRTYAFESLAWRDGEFLPVFLTEIHRQENDDVFADIVNDIRLGATHFSYPLEPERTGTGLEALNATLGIFMPPGPHAVSLCMTRKQASSINERRERENPNPARIYRGRLGGAFDCDSLPSDLTLVLKEGSRVMVTANLGVTSAEGPCVNGDLGAVLEVDEEYVTVSLDKGGHIKVGPHTWVAFCYAVTTNPLDGEEVVEPVPIGSYTQIPLRLAHALTVHRCQGLPLDAVHVHFGAVPLPAGRPMWHSAVVEACAVLH